ncbi:MAG: hypothetical protein VYE22_11265 [Myxococcota bacterium]|nr:hypothetical protein [Myxococcota bacterium]
MPERWWREPLLHFLALGAALFAADAALRPAEEEARVIVVDGPLRRELAERLETRLGRPPTEEERAADVERWVEDEVLYREGLRRGFDAHDPTVRARVAARMERVLREGVIVPAPDDDALRELLRRDPGRWAEEARVDFTQVYVEGHGEAAEARAEALLGLLRAGASPAGLGDRFSGGRRYRSRRLSDLAASFGEGFVDGLDAQPPGSWALRRSRAGLHLVRLDARTAPASPSFDALRDDLRRAWIEEAETRAVAEETGRLKAGWEIRTAP